MKAKDAVKKTFKTLYLLLKIIFVIIAVLVLIIVLIESCRRYERVGLIKAWYPNAFQLIEEKYDNKIYLSDRRYGSIILEFTAKRSFENTYNVDDLPKEEFYTLVGHEIFNCFKDEITKEIEHDKANGTHHFEFPVHITIKYGNSDEYIHLEFYEKDWSE